MTLKKAKSSISFSKEEFLKKYIQSSCLGEKTIREVYKHLDENLVLTLLACDLALSNHSIPQYVAGKIQAILSQIFEEMKS